MTSCTQYVIELGGVMDKCVHYKEYGIKFKDIPPPQKKKKKKKTILFRDGAIYPIERRSCTHRRISTPLYRSQLNLGVHLHQFLYAKGAFSGRGGGWGGMGWRDTVIFMLQTCTHVNWVADFSPPGPATLPPYAYRGGGGVQIISPILPRGYFGGVHPAS